MFAGFYRLILSSVPTLLLLDSVLPQISTTAGWAEAWLAMSVENTEERPDRCVEPNSAIGSLGSCGRY